MPATIEEQSKKSDERSSVSHASMDGTTNASATVLVSVGNCEKPAKDFHPLYWLRKERGLSLRDVGDLAGLAPTQIQLYENGTVQPRIGAAFRLAAALDVSVDWLFGIPYKKLARAEVDR